jgi:hypothetical protein
MDLQAKKLWLIEWLLSVQDARILSRVESIVKESPDFWDDLSPEAKSSVEQGLNDYQTGKVFTSDEVKGRIKAKFNL